MESKLWSELILLEEDGRVDKVHDMSEFPFGDTFIKPFSSEEVGTSHDRVCAHKASAHHGVIFKLPFSHFFRRLDTLCEKYPWTFFIIKSLIILDYHRDHCPISRWYLYLLTMKLIHYLAHILVCRLVYHVGFLCAHVELDCTTWNIWTVQLIVNICLIKSQIVFKLCKVELSTFTVTCISFMWNRVKLMNIRLGFSRHEVDGLELLDTVAFLKDSHIVTEYFKVKDFDVGVSFNYSD